MEKTLSLKKDLIKAQKLKLLLKSEGQLSPSAEMLVDSLITMCSYLTERVEGLEEENKALKSRLLKLEYQVNKNSSNSSVPPSKDANRSNNSRKHRKGKKTVGGQPGHRGTTLLKVNNPDKKIVHPLQGKCACGRALSQIKKKPPLERQVVDIEIKKLVTSHLAEVGECTCGRTHQADFPTGVNNYIQYGSLVRGLASYFNQYQLIPFERTQEIFNDLFGLSLCKGTVFNTVHRSREELNKFEDWVKKKLLESSCNHADESGLNIENKKSFLHVLSNNFYTYLHPHLKRGKEAVNEMGVLESYKGLLVHDCYSMYFSYPSVDIICNTHLCRELTFFEEQEHLRWCHKIRRFLQELKELTDDNKKNGLKLKKLEVKQIKTSYNKILRQAKKENLLLPKLEGKKKHPAINLLNRLIKYKDGILRFCWDFSAPFTNNQAERDLRMCKVQQKISGCFRTFKGAKIWCQYRSFISTIKKHNLSVLEGIQQIFCSDGLQLNQLFNPSG